MIKLESKPAIRQLLIDTQTNRYYKGGGEWTLEPEEAQSFDNIDYIRALVKYCRLRNAELVQRSSNGEPDVHIPLDENSPAHNRSSYTVVDGATTGTVFPRSATTGELLQELQRERDAAQFELFEAKKSIDRLSRKLNALKTKDR